MIEINGLTLLAAIALAAILAIIIAYLINRPDKSSLKEIYKPIVYDDKWKPDTKTENKTTQERYLEDEKKRKS